MRLVYMLSPEARIWLSEPSIVLPAAYGYDGFIQLQKQRYDDAILISPFGIYMALGEETENKIVEYLEELVVHECIHALNKDWKHSYDIISVKGKK